MYHIRLLPPERDGRTMRFRWEIEPEGHQLSRRPGFELSFPESVRLERIPERLWWDLFLLIMHPQWAVLQPVEVSLPIHLTANEIAFWRQILQTATDTMNSVRIDGRAMHPAEITFKTGDTVLPQTPLGGAGAAAAFSSGKDSLTQAALLFELGQEPILVTTTSPLPPLDDHLTDRRRAIFAGIRRRRNATLIEVKSDCRANWNLGLAQQRGYVVSGNELTDTFLYMANLIAVGVAFGRSDLYFASEAEVQECGEMGGAIIQHPHFMYAAATQRAFAAYLAPYGLRFGSLIWPLYSMQVQQLLWRRFGDLADLQYSCWRTPLGKATCSRCEQCMRIAVTAFADGENPERMGIDFDELMEFSGEWEADPQPETWVSPLNRGARRSFALVRQAIRKTRTRQVAMALFKSSPRRLLSARTRRSLKTYAALRARLLHVPSDAEIGVREAYLDWLEPKLKAEVEAIYRDHFAVEPRSAHASDFDLSEALTARAIAALNGSRP